MIYWNRRIAAGLLLLNLFTLDFSERSAVFAADPEVTVYNQNFALIKDYRTLSLKAGENRVFLDDVAALIDPTSVHFKSLTAPDGVQVLEQNFRYDLISRTSILDRMVGQKIRFRKDGTVREGILLNPVTTYVRPTGYNVSPYNSYFNQTTNNTFAIQTPEGILLTDLNEILVDELPKGLYPRPTLMWDLFSSKAGQHNTEVAYLTDGVNWFCDYVLTVNADDSRIDLTGWVTLNNQSGAGYRNARLKLVAGDVRRAEPGAAGGVYKRARLDSMVASEAVQQRFQEESFFEYHLYTLQNRTSVENNETKQVTLVTALAVPIEKRYIYDPDRMQYTRWLYQGWSDGVYGTINRYGQPGQGDDTSPYKKVNTLLILKNSKENHLGLPLPKGRVRVNKADAAGSVQFVGEDWIDHTPKDEKIELYVGDAFDLVGEKKRTQYRQESHFIEESYEVKLRNHKKSPVTIQVTDHLFGDWSILSTSDPFTQQDAHTIRIPITVPPDGERVVNYTIRVKRP